MRTKSKPRPLSDSETRPNVVPMGSFVDPNWPEAAGASVNYGHDKFEGVEDHPLEHNPAYGQVQGGLGAEEGTDADGNREPFSGVESSDRAEWNAKQWAALAKQYDLPAGGKKDDVIARVLAHEQELATNSDPEGTGNGGTPENENGGEPDGS